MKVLSAILRLYWRHYPGWFFWGLMLALISALASIALMAVAGWYLGATLTAGASAAGSVVAFNTVYPGFPIRAAAFTRTFGRYGERVLTHDATFRFLAKLRLHVFDGIAQMPFRRLRDFRSGELLARLTADIDALDGLYLRVVLPLVTALLATLLLLLGLHWLNAPMAAVVGIIILATLIILPSQAARIGVRLGRRIAFANEALRLRYIDLLRGQVELIMAGRLGHQIASIQRAADKIRQLQDQLSHHDLLGRALIQISGGLALVSVLLIGGWAYEAGQISAPMLLLALLAVLALTELFGPIRRGLLDIGRSLYAGQRILPLMAEPISEPDSSITDQGPISLELNRVDFSYSPQAELILEDFSLTLRSGEAIGIVGGSGAGKSTLLALVAGMLMPNTGRIRLDYEDGRATQFSPRIGLLTQRTELFNENLAFNLRIAGDDLDSTELESALDEAQLGSLLDRLPDGLEHMLGDEGQGLSGGESRRLALARLLLFKPDLWLLDEATEGLDHNTAQAVLATLRQATRGKAVLFITHKKVEADLADQLLVLSEDAQPRLISRANQTDWDAQMKQLR